MSGRRASLDEIRGFYAKLMAGASRSRDPRLERIFELVPREAFLPPGPWKIMVGDSYIDTPSADPIYLYQNALVALDTEKGINNGEPFLHAAWIGAVSPQPGEMVTHIGAGMGYYSAILSMLVLPGGRVHAFEIEEKLAAAARENLSPFENATVTAGDAVSLPVPPSDLIYVNAGVAAPPAGWLHALRPGGRMIFPWRPSKAVGIATLVTARASGLEVKPLMPAWFIPCVGASQTVPDSTPVSGNAAWRSRSLHLTAQRAPDAIGNGGLPRSVVLLPRARAAMTSHAPRSHMQAALAQAEAAAARGEVPVGAVLVGSDGRVLARAGNRTRELADPTAHAELLAIREACRALGSERLDGTDLYVTLEPCPMCAAAISFARIRRLYFGALDPKGGGVEHGARIFTQPTCHHAPQVYGGIEETRAGDLLRSFFSSRR